MSMAFDPCGLLILLPCSDRGEVRTQCLFGRQLRFSRQCGAACESNRSGLLHTHVGLIKTNKTVHHTETSVTITVIALASAIVISSRVGAGLTGGANENPRLIRQGGRGKP
jgi:hypothetical protein